MGCTSSTSIGPDTKEWPVDIHNFERVKFAHCDVQCSKCNQHLSGFVNYSAHCKKCNTTIHKWCAPHFERYCLKGFPAIDRQENLVKEICFEGHNLVLIKTGYRSRRCWCCAGFVGRYYHTCYVCDECPLICHPHCVGNIKISCKNVQSNDSLNIIQGHKFVLTNNKIKKRCEKCHFDLDIFYTPAYKCEECGVNVHSDCKHFCNFECPSLYLSQGIDFLLRRHVTAASQGFICNGCEKDFNVPGQGIQSRFCHFSKRFYCVECHSNQSEVIPERVLLHWDFTPDTVSDWSKFVVQYIRSKAFIPMKDISPFVTRQNCEITSFERLLMEVISYYKNLPQCRRIFDKILKKIKVHWPNFLEEPLHFSLANFENIYECFESEKPTCELFYPMVIESHEKIIQHARHLCQICMNESYRCAICCPRLSAEEMEQDDGDVLYPFEKNVAKCSNKMCASQVCVHRRCLQKNPKFQCPSCKSKINNE